MTERIPWRIRLAVWLVMQERERNRRKRLLAELRALEAETAALIRETAALEEATDRLARRVADLPDYMV